MIERTLVLVKPDGVQRGLVGEVIERFEKRGLKPVGMKMVWADKEFAREHYTEEIAEKHGEKVRDNLLQYITQGPVVAMVLEGAHAVEVTRKIVGPTGPKEAPPGTIRGDLAHHSLEYADDQDMAAINIVHASGNPEEAVEEISLWFDEDELHTYERVDERHHLG